MSDWTLKGFLKLDASNYDAALKKSVGAAKGMAVEAGKVGQQMGGAFSGAALRIGAFAGVFYAVVNQFKEAIRYASEFKDISEQFGTSTDALQRWAYAFEKVGADASKLPQALMKVAEARDKAIGGDETMAAKFSALGISVSELKGTTDTAALFEKVGEAVGGIANEMDRATLAADMFGAKNSKMIQAFATGEMRNAGKELGNFAMSPEVINSLEKTGDLFGTLKIKAKSALATAYAYATDPSLRNSLGVEYSAGGNRLDLDAALAERKKAKEPRAESITEKIKREAEEKKAAEEKLKRVGELTKKIGEMQLKAKLDQMTAEEKLHYYESERAKVARTFTLDMEEQLIRKQKLLELDEQIAKTGETIKKEKEKGAGEFGKVARTNVGGWQSIGGFASASGLAAATRNSFQQKQLSELREIKRATRDTAAGVKDGGLNW